MTADGFMRVLRIIFLMLFVVFSCPFAYGKVIYVDNDAVGTNNGSSWQNAYTFLQDALADADATDKPVEIRVAQGIYKPDEGSTQTLGNSRVSFRLINDVTIRGGYAGLDKPDPNDRNIKTYETVLSGDLSGNDVYVNDPCDLIDERTRFDNSWNVVEGSNTDATAVLDGFTITGGHITIVALGGPAGGAGMLVYSGSPTLLDCTFTGNATSQVGGGMYNRNDSHPTLINCTFAGNYAESGGGMSNMPGYLSSEGSHPELINCTFDNNCARQLGGGMYNFRSNPTLTDCTFSLNRVVGPYSMSRGSDTGVGGGMYSSYSSPVLTDCLFSENSAGGGGGICNGNDSSIALTNCTFIGNSASQAGAGLLNPEDSTLTLTNCRFINNTVTGIGGGVWNGSNNATLVDCVFSGNSAHDGQIPNVSQIILGHGGGMSAGGTPTLIRCTFRSNYATNGAGIIGGGELAECTFTGNSASEDGGAIHTIGEPIITNCTFSGNSANRGGGIFFTWGAKMTMANCTFAGNSASTGNALASDPHLPSLPGYFQLTNCILWDGENTLFDPDPYALRSAISCSNVQGGWPGEGNIDTDPLFAYPGYWTDANDPNIVVEPKHPDAIWVDGDYHLKSQAGRWDSASESWIQDDVTSPCIDAGDPNSLVGLELLPNSGRINMGVFGGTSQASLSLSTAVANGVIIDQQLNAAGQGYTVIRLYGSYYEMGYAHGDLLAEYVVRSVEETKELFGGLYAGMRTAMADSVWKPAEIEQELDGIVDALAERHPAAGIDKLDLKMFNGIGDLRYGCRSHTCWGPYVAAPIKTLSTRRLDFPTPIGSLNHHVLFVYVPDDGSAKWINLGFPGMVTAAQGVNESGTLVSLHDYNSWGADISSGRMPRTIACRYALTYLLSSDLSGQLSDVFAELQKYEIMTGTFLNYYAPEGHGGVMTCNPNRTGPDFYNLRTPQDVWHHGEAMITTNQWTNGSYTPPDEDFGADVYYSDETPKTHESHWSLVDPVDSQDGLQRLSVAYRGKGDMAIWADGRIDGIGSPRDFLRRTPRLEYEWSELFGPYEHDEAAGLGELAESLALSWGLLTESAK